MTETIAAGQETTPATTADTARISVPFTAADGTVKTYHFPLSPLPAVFTALGAAFQARCDSGEMRTIKSVENLYYSTVRFMEFLSELDPAPQALGELTPEHLMAFQPYRRTAPSTSPRDARQLDIRRLLRHITPLDQLSHPLRIALSYPGLLLTPREDDGGTPVRVEQGPGTVLKVLFTASDGRPQVFDFTNLPLPALHHDLAHALRALLTRNGETVSLHVARNFWEPLRRFLIHLGTLEELPTSVSDLGPQHLQGLRSQIALTASATSAKAAVNPLRTVLGNIRPYELLSAELRRDLEHGSHSPTAAGARAVPVQRPGTGRTSAMPQGPYAPEETGAEATQSLTVVVNGEDGRRGEYDFATLPFPAFHAEFAAAFAARTGPTGSLRTRASADTAFGILRRFLAFMETLAHPPTSLGQLTVRHLERFRMHRLEGNIEATAVGDLMGIRLLLREVTPFDVLSEEIRDWAGRPGLSRQSRNRGGLPGYSDREFRDLMAAARSEAVAIRDRIRKGERLLAAFRTNPEALSEDERTLGAHLDTMDRTGFVPVVRTHLHRPVLQGRIELARHLFLTDADLAPLIVLAAGLTGRNTETLKDLPAEHRVLEGRAVAVNLTKRRRARPIPARP
ncbi:hypothetical protein VM98_24930 [Streptomyces rubellomurinus subsp. indigoferus]|nr:hypothetical protein VM98_24930 [Streptomyces rubellomurinus subsp. indigoferus]